MTSVRLAGSLIPRNWRAAATEFGREPAPGLRQGDVAYLATLAVLCVFRVCIDASIEICAQAGQTYDDALYVQLANSILGTGWLGPYQHLTLAKAPLYPVWLAGNHVLGLPLLVSQGVLYLAAGLLVIRELQLRGGARAWLAVVFAAYALSPFTETRLLREGIYGSLLTGSIAITAGVARRVSGGERAWGTAAAAGLSLGLAWLTREEGPLTLVGPAILLGAMAVGFTLESKWRSRWRSTVASAISAALIFASALGSVVALNVRTYGSPIINEQTTGTYRRAVAALLSVQPTSLVPYLLLPNETRRRLYAVSPAFASLSPYIDGRSGSYTQRINWARQTCAIYPETCGDFGGAWVLWVVQLAAADAGYHASAQVAQAYYERLASEVRQACESGQLPCNRGWSLPLPPLRGDDAEWVIKLSAIGARRVLSFPLGPGAFSAETRSTGPASGIADFERLANTRARPVAGLPAPDPDWPGRVSEALEGVYRLLFGPFVMVGVIALLVALTLWPWRRRGSQLLLMAIAFLASAAARIVLLAYLQATMFPTFTGWPAYLNALFPLLILASGAAVAGLYRVLRPAPPPRPAPSAPSQGSLVSPA